MNSLRGLPTYALLALALVGGCVAFALGQRYGERHRPLPRIENVAPADRAPTRGSTFVLRTALPSAPSAVRVHTVPWRTPGKPILLKLIGALPIQRTPETERVMQEIKEAQQPVLSAGEGVGKQVGDWYVQVVAGGAFSCFCESAPVVNLNLRQVQPPSEESVRAVADAFFARTGLLPKRARFSRVAACGRIDDTPIAWAAIYNGKLDGLPLQAGLSVTVGPDLELVGVRNTFRDVLPDRTVPILSPQEAFDMLCKGEGHFSATTVERRERFVESVELVYWQPPLPCRFRYVVPIYVFSGVDTYGRWKERWGAFVEAIRPEYLEKPRARPD